MPVSDSRAVVVWCSFAASIALFSGVLLWLEPTPVAPGNGPKLWSSDRRVDPEKMLFATAPTEADRWEAIYIYDSGSLRGNGRQLGRLHQEAGLGGLGYHFVINNGNPSPDGQIEIGFRWTQMAVGAHGRGSHADWINQRAIGICVVGDFDEQPPTDAQMRELAWLVSRLQERFEIPDSRLTVWAGADEEPRLGRYFPLAFFRDALALAE
jgi:hypothetical protein